MARTWRTSSALALADRKSTRLNSSPVAISYAVFCLKKKKNHCPQQIGKTDGAATFDGFSKFELQTCIADGNFFHNDTATTEIYTLSLHDALPISRPSRCTARPPSWMRPTSNVTRVRSDALDRKSTRLNSSHVAISYAVFCLK